MSGKFPIQPIGRFAGASQPVKRPKEFACFSYDDNHEFHLNDSSIKYYYTPQLGADLSKGYESFQKLDDSEDGHLDALLKTIMAYESEQGEKIDAEIITWRGMMTKILGAPFENFDGYAALTHLSHSPMAHDQQLRDERHPISRIYVASKEAQHKQQQYRSRRGYKFETLSTLPSIWAETSRDYIEAREDHVVNNKAQYCSVVRTGIGSSILCLGGEVDAIWDFKPIEHGKPINWVELKTALEIRGAKDMEIFHRKLMKFWIQSFLLGVPKIVVGFRDRDGFLVKVDEIETQRIPQTVNATPNPSWNADLCVNFAGTFLEWLKQTINDEGVWRIRRLPQTPEIEVFKVEETGHGDILSEEFKNFRIKLALQSRESAA
ncbi:uncharacterized protein J7T54_001323 [Emericellopsis cladophorae]|uniref:Decapping nuclease n=1 Tax=Emericellopsis cladophorae TaxID=2686198 RepID=A0A9Q0BF28_9HYPO|nr:uncharacterized protein J7T54_001323 [Emericellopsis cladophorae]KAI6782466.1 hypothetical protein J7T54_001323 [Emericellopsis cladophorae]